LENQLIQGISSTSVYAKVKIE